MVNKISIIASRVSHVTGTSPEPETIPEKAPPDTRPVTPFEPTPVPPPNELPSEQPCFPGYCPFDPAVEPFEEEHFALSMPPRAQFVVERG